MVYNGKVIAFFPISGPGIVKVSELVAYIDDYPGVRYVLEYKFRKLEEQAAESAANKSEDTTEDK